MCEPEAFRARPSAQLEARPAGWRSNCRRMPWRGSTGGSLTRRSSVGRSVTARNAWRHHETGHQHLHLHVVDRLQVRRPRGQTGPADERARSARQGARARRARRPDGTESAPGQAVRSGVGCVRPAGASVGHRVGARHPRPRDRPLAPAIGAGEAHRRQAAAHHPRDRRPVGRSEGDPRHPARHPAGARSRRHRAGDGERQPPGGRTRAGPSRRSAAR